MLLLGHRSPESLRCALAGLSMLVLGLTASLPAAADVPDGRLVMLDIWHWDTVTNKVAPSNTRLSWREIIDAGINGVHFRSWHSAIDTGYRWWDLIEEAHEYGLWVGAGNPFSPAFGWNDTLVGAGMAAEHGADFIQIDEPLTHNMTEAEYNQIKAAAQAENPNCPVLITDVFYNDTVAGFSNCDGLIQEVYVDEWYPLRLDQLSAYQAAHPSQHAMMWVWMPNRHTVADPCVLLPDSKFDLWFNESLNRFDKVILFIFRQRTTSDPCNDVWSANWDARVPTIQAATQGLRKPLPDWQNFSPDQAVETGSPDCAVEVRSEAVGLDPTSVLAHYSIDGGETWTSWPNVECSGSLGTTDWVTITARDIPFEQISSTLNRVRFKIRDTYSGTYYRSARTDTMKFTVDIASLSGDLDAGIDDAGIDDASIDDASVDDAGPGDAGLGDAGGQELSGGCGCAQSSPGHNDLLSLLLLLGLWISRAKTPLR